MLLRHFSWCWFWRTCVFYYFCLDYRRPYAIFAYLGLLATLTLFYGLGSLIALDVCFIYTLPVPAASRHSRARGNPGDERHGD